MFHMRSSQPFTCPTFTPPLVSTPFTQRFTSPPSTQPFTCSTHQLSQIHVIIYTPIIPTKSLFINTRRSQFPTWYHTLWGACEHSRLIELDWGTVGRENIVNSRWKCIFSVNFVTHCLWSCVFHFFSVHQYHSRLLADHLDIGSVVIRRILWQEKRLQFKVPWGDITSIRRSGMLRLAKNFSVWERERQCKQSLCSRYKMKWQHCGIHSSQNIQGLCTIFRT